MWLLAIAVAILGTHALQLAGLIDLTKSIYVRPNFTWLSYLLGGFLFGVGMTLGSGCGSKTLVRLGGGSLKSLIVFVFLGIAAYMTLKGLFAIWRQGAIDRVAADLNAAHMPRQDLPTMIAALIERALRGSEEFWVRPEFPLYRAGEPVREDARMLFGGLVAHSRNATSRRRSW